MEVLVTFPLFISSTQLLRYNRVVELLVFRKELVIWMVKAAYVLGLVVDTTIFELASGSLGDGHPVLFRVVMKL
jgi:hypothetical protein